MTKAQQTLVDTDTFFELLALRARLLDSLGASQIHKVELGTNLLSDLRLLIGTFALFLLLNFLDNLLLNRHSEHSM